MIAGVRGRPPTAGEGPPACPFVAFAEEPDSRSGVPDHRHRCHALEPPEPRAYAHQERYCLTSAYPGCAYFQDWAVRHAAETVAAPGTVGASWEPERGTRSDRPPVPARGARFERARAAASRLGGGGRDPGQLAAFGDSGDSGDSGDNGRLGGIAERNGGVTYASSRGVEFMRPNNDPRDARYAPEPGYEDSGDYGAAREYAEDAYGATRGEADYASTESYGLTDDYTGAGRYAPPLDPRRGQYAGAPDDGPEPARGVEYARSRSRGRTTTPTRNGDSGAYSGYPTAARLLGITPPPTAADFDDAPEPGKWERSGRLQTWLEDAEQSGSVGRVQALDEVEELEAGVMPARAMQARRAPATPLRPVMRNNARKALPWERRAAEDGYPQVRAAQSGRRVPTALVAMLVLLFAAGVLFALPSMLPLVAGKPRQASTQPPSRPAPAAVAPTATPTPKPTKPPPAEPTPRIYRVQSGDNLSGIASRFKVTVKEILAANPDVTDPAQIHIGQRLTIPLVSD